MALYNESLSALALSPALRLATANGVTIDRTPAGNPYEQLLFVVIAGAITDGTHTIAVQHSDDGSTWVNVPAGQINGALAALTTAQSNSIAEVGVNSSRRFVRLNITVSGSPATGGIVGAVAVLADPSILPVR